MASNATAQLNPQPPRIVDESVTKKVALAALVGTALEWYDFFLFTTAAALVFNTQYFVSQDPFVAAMSSFATLAVGFVARPIGGFIFGALGDKIGRKKILMVTIVGHRRCHRPDRPAAELHDHRRRPPRSILVALRILQGLAVGGEWSGAVIIAVENAPVAKRARYAALPQIGSPIGTILSSGGFFGMLSLVGQSNFDAWGWRIPFVAALPLLAISLWIRSKLSESPEFEALMESGETEHAPIRGVLTKSWRQILVGMCSALLGIGGFYLITSFVVFYGTKILKMPSEILLPGSLLAAVFEIFVLIWAGRMGEKYGASKVILWGGVASAVVAVPVFLAINTAIPVLVILAMIIGVATLSDPVRRLRHGPDRAVRHEGPLHRRRHHLQQRRRHLRLRAADRHGPGGRQRQLVLARRHHPAGRLRADRALRTAPPRAQHRRRGNEALSTTTAGHLIVAPARTGRRPACLRRSRAKASWTSWTGCTTPPSRPW